MFIYQQPENRISLRTPLVMRTYSLNEQTSLRAGDSVQRARIDDPAKTDKSSKTALDPTQGRSLLSVLKNHNRNRVQRGLRWLTTSPLPRIRVRVGVRGITSDVTATGSAMYDYTVVLFVAHGRLRPGMQPIYLMTSKQPVRAFCLATDM